MLLAVWLVEDSFSLHEEYAVISTLLLRTSYSQTKDHFKL